MEAAVNEMKIGESIANGSAVPESPTASAPPQPISLDDRLLELEVRLIRWALDATNGNKSRAAELLQVKRSTLGDRIKHCGLDRVSASTPIPDAAEETPPR